MTDEVQKAGDRIGKPAKTFQKLSFTLVDTSLKMSTAHIFSKPLNQLDYDPAYPRTKPL